MSEVCVKFIRRDGEAIARKLGAETRGGGSHDKVMIKHDGKLIAVYGLRRDKHASHNYIPGQIFISHTQCRDLVACPLSVEQYFQILRDKHKIDDSNEP